VGIEPTTYAFTSLRQSPSSLFSRSRPPSSYQVSEHVRASAVDGEPGLVATATATAARGSEARPTDSPSYRSGILADVAVRHRYEAGRPVVVARALRDLAGPTHGLIRLPSSLEWSTDRDFDLDDDSDRRLLYETVLREARHDGDLASYLDDEVLVGVWDRLWLPRRVRQAWETAFPVLAQSAA
jgi:hypothetical protein